MLDPAAIRSIDVTLAEVRRRRREYARPTPFAIPAGTPIKRSEFEAVAAAAAAILEDDGRLSVETIADRLRWRSHGRVRTVIHTLRKSNSWHWTLQTSENCNAG